MDAARTLSPISRYPTGRLTVGLALVLALLIVIAGAGAGQADPLPAPDAYPRVAFVARNDVPFDSLSLGPVAGAVGGIVVITSTGSLGDPARQALVDFDPDLVVIAGGTAAISDATAAQIAAAGPWEVVRKSGPTRDDTAAAIATLLVDLGVGRPALTGDGQVIGDVRVGGQVHADTLAVAKTDHVANLNADLLDGLDSTDFLGVGDQAVDAVHADDADTVGGIDSVGLQFPAVVPAGVTVIGRYGFEYDTDGNGEWGGQIAYPVPMPEALDVQFIDAPGTPTPECPGTAAEPAASPGFLCMYEVALSGTNTAASFFRNSRFGVNFFFVDDGVAGGFYGSGTWAATAPDGPAAAPNADSEADSTPSTDRTSRPGRAD
jgi:hypothetical protein